MPGPMPGWNARSRIPCRGLAVLSFLLLIPAEPVEARGPGADCCADLEERVADLEAAMVRSGNRRIELTLSGAVSTALLGWNDGAGLDGSVVTNDGEGTKIEISGEHDGIGEGGSWNAGFLLEVGIIRAGSGSIDQIDLAGPEEIEVAEGHVWVRHKSFGTLAVGQVGGGDASENATEADLSGTALASYSGVEDIGGGFFLRSGTDGAGDLTPVTWGDLIDHMAGVDGNVVRYDTPRLAGFVLTAEWGEDDAWEVALGYTNVSEDNADGDGGGSEGEGFLASPRPGSDRIHVAGVLSYHEVLEDDDTAEHRTVSGSISVLDTVTGLNLTYAGGHRRFLRIAELTDGSLGELAPAAYHYLKAGWLKDIGLGGETGLYAEWGRFRDLLGRDADEEAVAALGGIGVGDVCGGAGLACILSSSEAEIWGAGIVQTIDSAEMKLYLGYRHHEARIGLDDDAGTSLGTASTEDFQTFIAGALIDF